MCRSCTFGSNKMPPGVLDSWGWGLLMALIVVQNLITAIQGAEVMGDTGAGQHIVQVNNFIKHNKLSFHRGFF